MATTIEQEFELLTRLKNKAGNKIGNKEIFFAASAFMFGKVLDIMKNADTKAEFDANLDIIKDELTAFFKKENDAARLHKNILHRNRNKIKS